MTRTKILYALSAVTVLAIALFVLPMLAFAPAHDQAAGSLTLAAAAVALPRFGLSRIGRPRFRVRKTNPVVEGKLYVYRQPWWDAYMVKAASALNVQTLFQAPIGQQYTPNGGTGGAKTLYHTNMGINGAGAGQFPSPDKFFVMGIGFSVRADISAADATNLLEDLLVDLQIGGRSFALNLAFRVGQAGGAYGQSSALIANGLPTSNPENEFRTFGEQGETIEQQQGFKVVCDPTQVWDAAGTGVPTAYTTASSGAGVNAHVFLDGYYYREIL
jgi:hypothetical protein